MSLTYNAELAVATKAVYLASRLTKQHLLTYQSQKSQVSEETKSDASEVTVADFAAQAVIISIIHHAFPEDDFIAEESGDMLRTNSALAERVFSLVSGCAAMQYSPDASQLDNEAKYSTAPSEPHLPQDINSMIDIIDLGQRGGTGKNANRTWILDPIDGTKTYIRAQQYAVCLCLVHEGEQRVAVLGCSNLDISNRSSDNRVVIREDVVDLSPTGGWLLSAVKGNGTHLEPISGPGLRRPIKDVLGDHSLPSNDTGSSIRLRFTDSSASPHTTKSLHNVIFEHFSPTTSERKLSIPAVPEGYPSLAVDLWSMQLKYVILALKGADADAMIRIPPQSDYHAAVWDHAGGQLLLTESGGYLTDAKGVPFVLDGQTRKLVHNWGVCATRGDQYSDGHTSKTAHQAVLEKIKTELAKK